MTEASPQGVNPPPKKIKVCILEEKDYNKKVAPPPNFLPCFFCKEMQDKWS
jgi:hypothetical protein